ncbi:hypothetical protein [Streptomyces albogriseolus]|uniref:hypothetical protein n=1 Tax=Streptomyces albogriseolus TaxID=1887 RepID=UPI0037028E77
MLPEPALPAPPGAGTARPVTTARLTLALTSWPWADEDWDSSEKVEDAIDMVAATGPTLGRPLVDRIKGAEGAGDRAGNWQRWYDINIPLAEERYQARLADLKTREYE